MQQQQQQREAWSYGDLAEAYSLSTRTIRRLVARGDLTAFRIGGAVRITEASRAAWASKLPLKSCPAEQVAA